MTATSGYLNRPLRSFDRTILDQLERMAMECAAWQKLAAILLEEKQNERHG
jgi:hypothetical protein